MRFKIIPAVAVFFTIFAFSQCKASDPVAQLEELPKESSEKLQKVEAMTMC